MAFFQEQKTVYESIHESDRTFADRIKDLWEGIQSSYDLIALFCIPVAFFIGLAFSPIMGVVLGGLAYAFVIILLVFNRPIFALKTMRSIGLLNAEQYIPNGQLDATIFGVIRKAIPLESEPDVFAPMLRSWLATIQESNDQPERLERDDEPVLLPSDEELMAMPADIRGTYQTICLQAERRQKHELQFLENDSEKEGTEVIPAQQSLFTTHINNLKLSKYDIWYIEMKRPYSLAGDFYKRFFVCFPKGIKSIDDAWIKTERELMIEGTYGKEYAYVPNLLLVGEWRGMPMYFTLNEKSIVNKIIRNINLQAESMAFDQKDAKLAEQNIEVNFAYGVFRQKEHLEYRLEETQVVLDNLVKRGVDIKEVELKTVAMLLKDEEPADSTMKLVGLILLIITLGALLWYMGAYHWIELPPIFGDFPDLNEPPTPGGTTSSEPIEGSIGLLWLLLGVMS